MSIVEKGRNEIDGVLILIDEADKPPSSANLGELCKLLTERLTRKGCERVVLGLTGLPGIIGKMRERHESSPRVFSTMVLEPLGLHECQEVVDRGLDESEKKNGFRTKITDDAKGMIARLSEGYPHFLQEFAHCAFEEDDDDHIDQDDVIEGTYAENGALDQLGMKYFNDLYIDQINSEEYRKVLQIMAGNLDGWVGRAAIIKESGVKDRTVDNALQALKKKNIILVNPRKQGEYRLPTKSFAVWIRAREAALKDERATEQPLFNPLRTTKDD